MTTNKVLQGTRVELTAGNLEATGETLSVLKDLIWKRDGSLHTFGITVDGCAVERHMTKSLKLQGEASMATAPRPRRLLLGLIGGV
jgi:hypothetical protein